MRQASRLARLPTVTALLLCGCSPAGQGGAPSTPAASASGVPGAPAATEAARVPLPVRVVDPRGRPVPDARVSLEPLDAPGAYRPGKRSWTRVRAGRDGVARGRAVPGPVEIRAEHDGHAGARQRVDLPAGGLAQPVVLQLRPAGLAVGGRVHTADDGPVAHVHVQLQRKTPGADGAPLRQSTTTDEHGAFRLTGLAPGRWQVLVSGGPRLKVRATRIVELAAGRPEPDLDILLAPSPAVRAQPAR